MCKDCKSCNLAYNKKFNVFNWLEDLPQIPNATNLIEVHFKSTRKLIYENVNEIPLKKGDLVLVEAKMGHDIGAVSLTGELVLIQLKKNFKKKKDVKKIKFKKIYRKANELDIKRLKSAKKLEEILLKKAKKIANAMNLKMKIGFVEFQADKTKVIFYYISEERVDFRYLIKVLADEFKVRIEMKQLGVRQEAGKIGGIGSCGRKLCCAAWMHSFSSVTTGTAKKQDLALNPNKLAGQCGKLKCCLNFEVDTYIDAKKDFPDKNIVLKTKEGLAFYKKADILKRQIWYSFEKESNKNLILISIERAKKIIELNDKGIKVDKLVDIQEYNKKKFLGYENVVGQESLTRFDKK